MSAFQLINTTQSYLDLGSVSLPPKGSTTVLAITPRIVRYRQNGMVSVLPDLDPTLLYTVINKTGGVTYLQGERLDPDALITVYGLTDELLRMYSAGSMSIIPDPFTVTSSGGGGGGGGGTPSDPGDGNDYATVVNAEATTLFRGQAVYASSSGIVRLGIANVLDAKNIIGLVADDAIAPGASGKVITGGVLSASTVQWNVVTSMLVGLVTNSRYYLGLAPGRISPAALDASGVESRWSVQLGYAISSTELKVEIQPSIRL